VGYQIVHGPVPAFPGSWAGTVLARVVVDMLEKDSLNRPTMATVRRRLNVEIWCTRKRCWYARRDGY
jgi:hypothetical protein